MISPVPAHLTLLEAVYPIDLYDGFEPDDYRQKVDPKATSPWLTFSFSDLLDLRKLTSLIGEEAFRQIEASGIQRAMADGPWVGRHHLSLSYVFRTDGADRYLTIVEFGEFQPARYRVMVESCWRVSES